MNQVTTPNEELRARLLRHASELRGDNARELIDSLQEAAAALARQEEGREAVAGVPLEKIAAHTELMAAGPLHMSGHTDAVGQAIKLIRAGGSGYRKPAPPIAAKPATAGQQAAGVSEDFPPLPKCWTGSPVTVTWAEDGEATTREVYTAEQMYAFVIADREARTVSGQQAAGVSDAWREAIIDECTIACIDWDEADPRSSLARLIAWREQIALDPAVSNRAAALTATGAAPEGWQPIETCPHGDVGPGEPNPDVLVVSRSGRICTESPRTVTRLREAAVADGEDCIYTHWQPLPAAPNPGAQHGQEVMRDDAAFHGRIGRLSFTPAGEGAAHD